MKLPRALQVLFDGSGAGRDLGLAAGVGLIIAILLVPLPGWFLDICLALSIAASVMILMAALLIEKPLQMSAFPTMLLIVTLFRLALNIATTRLILNSGHEGTHAAGHVIEAFGAFLMGGSAAIGLTIFLILVLINFVVITKGAGRIAEVAARFSLDAMPGKQMAIDADLSTGAIDEKNARERRQELESESAFYGSMDGASKFVRGDAIAGLIITGVNIIVGIAIGLITHGLSFGQAFETYTLLTVGDGLVSQIPALIISVGAGILVSKGGVTGKAEAAIAGQLTRDPKTFGAAATVLGAMALLPGIPFIPFAGLAAGAAYAAHRIARRAAWVRASSERDAQVTAAATPQDTHRLLQVDAIRIEFGCALVPIVNDPLGEPRLDDQILALRRHFATDLGFIMPPVRMLDNLALQPGEYVIYLREIAAARGELRPDRVMALVPNDRTSPIPGEPAREPVFGLPAIWIDRSLRDEARFHGLTVVDAASVITTHITEIVKAALPELFGHAEMQALLESLPPASAKLAGELIPAKLQPAVVQRVLQRLLAERVSIRDMALILDGLAEACTWTNSISGLTEHVRQKLGRQIVHGHLSDGVLPVVTLSADWEATLQDAMTGEGPDRQLALSPTLVSGLVTRMKTVFAEVDSSGEQAAALVSPMLRPALRQIVDRVRPDLAVLSTAELGGPVRLRTAAVI
ncbi:flagellar biosynthesis protein FlhA [Sandaracinobacteroides saxicola]|uniref:Flagellar biosynthesis protein FlhA n=1 Tax=Sandaracinobacteroides saxicola TaxID=2759707 RepID=A0A7G5IJZ4_9SPHN|nr:flagellar biosynthesis protein FlhA [Sandaracinobacteroides saxicola]QMW23686.1 flagellar biosynthesis protein FlhA [Sandaracinobacteroides saxicola]